MKSDVVMNWKWTSVGKERAEVMLVFTFTTLTTLSILATQS